MGPLRVAAVLGLLVSLSNAAVAQQAPAPAEPQTDAPQSAAPPAATASDPATPQAPANTPEVTAGTEEETVLSRLEELERENAEQKARIQKLEADAATAQEMSDLSGALDDADVSLEEERLRIYGFTDVALTKIYVGEDTRFSGLIDRHASFALGNLNVYLDASPHDSIRVLSEVRFSLAPHGNLNSDFERYDASALDISSATGRNRVIQSSIILERAWIEWNEYDAFKIRAGYFLTPYGIWNIDHGAPVLISAVLPTFWASEYFPTHQMGAMALGELFHKQLEFGYRAYISNGRVTGQLDGDPFKTIGGRLYAKRTGEAVDMQVGLSGFWGQEATYFKEITSFEPFRVESTKVTQLEEMGVAADLSVDWGDLRLRGEFVLNQREYVEGLRDPGTIPGTFERDETRWNMYGIAAYRLPVFDLEPFIYFEHAERKSLTENRSQVYSAGLMWHIQPGTKLTFQAFHSHFGDDDEFPDASENDFAGWTTRLSSAF